MLSKQELGLPKKIDISNDSYDGDVTFAATESVDIRYTKVNGSCDIMTGVAPDEIEHVKENDAIR